MSGKRPTKYTHKLLLVAVFAAGFVLFGAPIHKAQALLPGPDPGSTGLATVTPVPDSGRFNPTGLTAYQSGSNNITPYYVIGNNAADYTYAKMSINVYVNQVAGGTVSISIINGGPDCYSITAGGLTGPDYNTTGGAPTTIYTIFGGGSAVVGTKTVSDSGCATVNFPAINVNKAADLPTPTNNFDGVFTVVASIGVTPNQGENSFRVQATSTAIAADAGFVGGSDQVAGFGYRDQNINNGNYWNSWMTFGVPTDCSNYQSGTPVSGESIQYYDTDISRTDWNTNMIIELQRQKINPDGSPNGGWDVVTGVAQKASQTLSDGSSAGTMAQNGTLYSGNFFYNYRYKLVLANMGVRNTIRIKLSNGLKPLYGALSERPNTSGCVKPKADAAACVSITPDISNPSFGTPVTMTVVVRNIGTTTWNSNYALRQTSPSGGNKPVSGSVGPGKTARFVFNLLARSPPPDPNAVNFQYQMFDASGTKFGPPTTDPLCQKTVTWSSSGTSYGGNVFASCYNSPYIWYQGNAFTTNAAGNVENGAPRSWTTIPGAFGGNNFNSTDQTNYVRVAVSFSSDGSDAGAGLTTNDPGYTLWVKVNPADDISPLLTWQQLPFGPFGDGSNTGGLRPQYSYTITLSLASDNFSASPSYTSLGSAVLRAEDNGPCLKVPGQTPTPSNPSPPPASLGCGGFLNPTDYEPGEPNTNVYNMQFVVDESYGAKFPVYNGLKDFSSLEGGNNRNYGYSVVVSGVPGVSASANAAAGAVLGTIDGTQQGLIEVPISVNLTANYTGSVNIGFYFGNTATNVNYFNCSAQITPQTRPYFKAYQGDISSGGAFESAAGGCTISSPANAGRILAYARPNTTAGGPKGASIDFGAYALGLIQGNPGGAYGFYDSAINGMASSYKNLSFANLDGGGVVGGMSLSQPLYGGVWAGTDAVGASSGLCAPDYYDAMAKTSSPSQPITTQVTIGSLAAQPTNPAGQYFYTAQPGSGSTPTLTIHGGTVTGQVTIFVKGNVYIDGNINYGSWDPLNPDAGSPYLAIIAQGNVVVAPQVKTLYGLYVAQGTGLADGSGLYSGGGVFATCSRSDDISQPAGTYELNHDCLDNQLTVNGSVVAQEVKLLRSLGTLWRSPGNNERPENGNTANSAEVFNYIPGLLLIQPNFQSTSSGAVTPGLLQGLYSLPPVF